MLNLELSKWFFIEKVTLMPVTSSARITRPDNFPKQREGNYMREIFSAFYCIAQKPMSRFGMIENAYHGEFIFLKHMGEG